MNDEPTILSIADTVSLVKKKYGEDWKDSLEALFIVFDTAKGFIRSDLEEHIPDLLDQFDVFKKTNKIKDQAMIEGRMELFMWKVGKLF